MWVSCQVDIETFLLLLYDTFVYLDNVEDWKDLNLHACVNLYSQNIVKHENLKYSVNDNLVRKNVLKYWKLLKYAVCEPLCQWSQLTQEEVEGRGVFDIQNCKSLKN